MTEFLDVIANRWAAGMSGATGQGAIAVVVVLLLCRIVPTMPGRVRCWLWRAVAVKMLLLLFVPGVIEIPVLAASGVDANDVADAGKVSTGGAARRLADSVNSANNASADSNASTVDSTITLPITLFVLWTFAVMLAFGFVARSAILVNRLRSQARALTDASLMEITWNCAERFGLPHIPRVAESNDIHSPAVAGLWKPVTLIPRDVLPNSSSAQVRMVLSHEIAHIFRRDLLWNRLNLLQGSLFFFHPLVWLALRKERLARETACDELAVRHSDANTKDYANTLLAVVKDNIVPRRPVFMAGVVESAVTLKRRILEMQHFESRSRMSIQLPTALFVLLAIPLLLPLRLVPQAAAESVARVATTPAPAIPSADPVSQPTAQPVPVDDRKNSNYQNFNEAWGVGVVFYNSRNYDAARKPLEAALKMATTVDQKLKVNDALIQCYRQQSDTSKMNRVVEYVLTHSASDGRKSRITRSYLSYLHQRGKTKAAVEDHEKRLKKDANGVLSLYLLSEIYTRTQPNPQRAVQLLDRLAKLQPDKKGKKVNVSQTAKLAMQYVRAKEYQKGAELYEKIAPLDQALAGYHYKEAAGAWMRVDNKKKALRAARNAVKSGPDNRSEILTYFWNRNLGDVFLQAGEAKEAIPLLETALTKTTIKGYVTATKGQLAEARSQVKD